MVAKRHAPFQPKYGVELGLRVRTRDPATNEVNSATCMFCQLFGRENKPGALRRPTGKVAVFKPPFRKDAIQFHHVGQHATRWAEYCALLSNDSRRAFWTSASGSTDILANETNGLSDRPLKTARSTPNLFLEVTSTSSDRPKQRVTAVPRKLQATRHWLINRDIVTVLIGVFVPYKSSPVTAREMYPLRAMAGFQDLLDETESRSGDATADDMTIARFRVVVKNPTQFQQFIDCLSASESLTTSATISLQASNKPVNGSSMLDDPRPKSSVTAAVTYARFLCAINFQQIADIAKSSGIYSIGLQIVPIAPALPNSARVGYCLHLQLRVFANGEVTSFHVLSVPLNNCHPLRLDELDRMFDTIEAALDVVVPRWRNLVLAVILEREGPAAQEARTGLCNALIGRFETILKPGFLKVCCVARQLDSLMQHFFSEILGSDEVYTELTALVAYISRQRALLSTMKTEAPSSGDNRWRSIASVMIWFRRYSVSIREYLKIHHATCSPHDTWWIRVILAARVSQEVVPMLHELSNFSTTTVYPEDAVVKLRASLVDWFSISGPLECNESPATKTATGPHNDSSVISKDGKYLVSSNGVFAALEDLGSIIADMLRAAKNKDEFAQSMFKSTVDEIAASVVDLVAGLTAIKVAMDGFSATLSDLPAVLPQDLVKMRGQQFTKTVVPHIERLRLAGWTRQEIEWIEQEFQDLHGAYFRETSLKLTLESCANTSSFRDSWSCLQGRFTHLRHFCEMMATAYPLSGTWHDINNVFVSGSNSLDTASSITKLPGNLETDVSDLSVQAVLQAKQFRRLQAVRLHVHF
uniref:Uncharacterized protein n=1 Tax=Peronospora matthiolae TaxID=2874970 RepID=A0AAV1VA68_9STRA